MASKTTKKKSSLKRKSPGRPRSLSTIPRRRPVPSVEEELFAKAFRSSSHPIGITELETGRCLEVNEACLEIFGFRRDEVVGQTTLMLGSGPDPQDRTRLIDRLKSEGTVRNLEVSMRTKEGELRQLIISTDLITLGGTRCLLTIGNDITERKRTEEALRQSEQRWQLAATGTTDGIWDWDVAGHTVFLSGRWKQVRGYREEEIGVDETEWSSRIHPDDSSRVMATVQSYFNKEIPTFDCEYRTRRKDGTYYWVSDRGIAVWDAQGRVVRMLGSEMDISEQKRAEEALLQLNETLEQRVAERTTALHAVQARLQILLRATPVVLYSCKVTGDYGATFISENVVEQLGHRPEDFTADSQFWVNHIHPDDRSRVIADLSTIFETNQHVHEYRFLCKDGTYRWLHDEVRVLRNKGGVPQEMIGFQIDISQRKQAEDALRWKQRELQQSQAQLQDLTAKLFTAQDSERQRIARDLHDDFSQRLTALVLDVASLQQHPPLLPELIGKALEPVREELQQLSKDLHDLAYTLHPSLLRHAGLQPAIDDYIQKAIERTGLHISLKAKDLPAAIPLDWSICLFRVLQESLQNVVKHAKATEVLVKLSGSSKGIGLSVIDNGKGIEERDKSSHQKGLGLISMRERLRLLNGFLNLHSRPADGTKVCAWIPFGEKQP